MSSFVEYIYRHLCYIILKTLVIYYILYYNIFGCVDMIQYSGLHLFLKLNIIS